MFESYSEETSHQGYRSWVLRFIMHAAIAVVGGMWAGSVLLGFVHVKPIGPHCLLITFLTDVPYSPAFWGSAFLAGVVVGKYLGNRPAIWIGPAALIVLIVLILASIPGYEHSDYELATSGHSFLKYIWGELFNLDCAMCAGEECLGKVLFTMPALNCVAYSLGAWISTMRRAN